MEAFRDREEAARELSVALSPWRGAHPLVLAIPRGAVPMAEILARELEGDFDVVLVRKIGAPGDPFPSLPRHGLSGSGRRRRKRSASASFW